MSPASRCPARALPSRTQTPVKVRPRSVLAACDQHARLRELGDRGRGADDDVRGLAAREPPAHLADRAERERDLRAGLAREPRGEVGDGVFHRAGKTVAASTTSTAARRARRRSAALRVFAVPVAVQGGGLELSARGDRAGAQVRRDRGRQVHLV